MVEDLKTIYEGKATIIKNREYLSSKEYIEPFIERMSQYTNKFICQVKPADQISTDGNTVDSVYNRVSVTAIFPEDYDYVFDTTYHRTVTMTYGLDVKKPICKFYTGVVDPEMNFYAFGGDCISIQEIEPETPIDYSPVQSIIDNGLKDNCKAMVKQLEELKEDKSNMLNILGEWVDFTIKHEYVNDSGCIKLPASMAVSAYKSLMIDKDSKYYSESDSNLFSDMYKSFANQITRDEKDITNRYEKTQLINQLLKL